MNEKRKFTRVTFDAQATLRRAQEIWDIRVLDLSFKGALVSRPQEVLDNGEAVTLDLVLADNITHIQMEAHVAHVEGEALGLECKNIDVDSMSHLRRFVELNTGSQDLLEREIDALLESS